MKMIYAPNYPKNYPVVSLFLAGSIEMGKADDWQHYVADQLKDYNVTLYNPRRNIWDSSWEQKIDNPQFNEQVTWELDNLEKADYIIMYFQPGTYSPISLLELGLFKTKCKVVCPEGFWRKGNVDIVCERYGISQFNSLDDLIGMFKQAFDILGYKNEN